MTARTSPPSELEKLGFRTVVSYLKDHTWELDAGALTTPDTEADALEHVQRVAARHGGRVEHAHHGWAPGDLQPVAPAADLAPNEHGDLAGLWLRLTEAAELNDPSPLTTLCAEWGAELERRFDFQAPDDDGSSR